MIAAMRFVICAVLAVVFLAGHSKCEQSTAPPQLYVSKGACPFECCTYRRWIANRNVALMDYPGGKAIAQVRKREEVLAITGEVQTHPLRFQVKEKGPDKEAEPVPVGSTVYLSCGRRLLVGMVSRQDYSDGSSICGPRPSLSMVGENKNQVRAERLGSHERQRSFIRQCRSLCMSKMSALVHSVMASLPVITDDLT
jgi:hypothetical protein